ncbi:uncharacterized protein LOC108462438 [Gossypium arboreum]|uniref:uncharacterized protein LOC108462438 n=1 Tax=Gossypium arboreum TaxID=29729 RepID=UPI000818F596|nr:uncharacterized protein LOC108462438 [Gossypium arboreum]
MPETRGTLWKTAWPSKGEFKDLSIRVFCDLMALAKIWEVLVEKGSLCHLNRVFEGRNTKDPSFCEFHSIEGHDIQSCEEFRRLLQNMMDNKEIGIFYKGEEANEKENELQELRDIWARWDEGTKQLFYQSYGDISYLLDIKVDKHLFRVMVQFWNSAYKCFTFGEVDLVPTVEEYTVLLRCPKVQVRKTFTRVFNGQTFAKKLMNISGMSEPWVTTRIQQKGDSKCILWENLRDLVLTHPDERKRVDIFVLIICGLVIFPKALRHVDEAITDLFDRLEKGITPVLAILVETFRSLSTCLKIGEGWFIGCAQLLMVWFHGPFWKVDKVSYKVFSEGYSPLKEEVAIQRREDISEEMWMEIL